MGLVVQLTQHDVCHRASLCSPENVSGLVAQRGLYDEHIALNRIGAPDGDALDQPRDVTLKHASLPLSLKPPL